MTEEALTILGARMREARLRRGVSQEAFAREVGLDRAYYGRIERGLKNISVITAARLAAALGVDLSVLTEGLVASDPAVQGDAASD